MIKKHKWNFLVQIISTNGLIRSSNLINELEKQSIYPNISPGVIPSTIDFDRGKLHSKIISALICQRNISKSEVGCALAHRNAINNFIESGFDYGLIFEDDAEILKTFDLEIISEFLSTEKPRILNLGWIPGFAIIFPKELQDSSQTLKVVTPPTCAFAYGFNQAAAQILSRNEKIIDLADWPIYTFGKIEYSIVNTPWVQASQDPENSIIGVRSKENLTTLNFKIRSRARLITSVIILGIASIGDIVNISCKQIINRILLKDHFYNYGVKNYEINQVKPGIAEIPMKVFRILRMLKLL